MAKKKGCLGCSLPVAITLTVVALAAIVLGAMAGPLGKALNIEGLPAWMSIDTPHPELPAEPIFHIFGFAVTNTIITTWITMTVLIILFIRAFRNPKLVPGKLQSIFESLLSWIYNLCTQTAGEKDGRKFFPFVATIFLFIIFNAFLSLIPGFGTLLYEGHHLLRGANTDLNTTLSLALITVVTVEYMGFKRFGFGYLRKFFIWGGIVKGIKLLFKKGQRSKAPLELVSGFMMAFAGILEGVGNFIRIISLSFRLFGNSIAGEILLLIMAFLIPFLIPLPFYGLEMLLGVIQALVFSSLAIVYISLAVMPHHEEH